MQWEKAGQPEEKEVRTDEGREAGKRKDLKAKVNASSRARSRTNLQGQRENEKLHRY